MKILINRIIYLLIFFQSILQAMDNEQPMNLVENYVKQVASDYNFPDWCKDINVKFRDGEPRYNEYSNTLTMPITNYSIMFTWPQSQIRTLPAKAQDDFKATQEIVLEMQQTYKQLYSLNIQEEACINDAFGFSLNGPGPLMDCLICRELSRKLRQDVCFKFVLGSSVVLAAWAAQHNYLLAIPSLASAIALKEFNNYTEYRSDEEIIKREKRPEVLKAVVCYYKALSKLEPKNFNEKTLTNKLWYLSQKCICSKPSFKYRAQQFYKAIVELNRQQ